MRKTWAKAFLLLAVAVVAYVAYAAWRNDMTQAGFKAIIEGMSKREVLALLGPPDRESETAATCRPMSAPPSSSMTGC